MLLRDFLLASSGYFEIFHQSDFDDDNFSFNIDELVFSGSLSRENYRSVVKSLEKYLDFTVYVVNFDEGFILIDKI